MKDTQEEAAIGNAAAIKLYEHEKAGEVLQAARDLIADKSRWTLGAMARRKAETDLGANFLGTAVEANSPDAVCWCALGAIAKTTDALVSYESPQQPVLRIRVADMAAEKLQTASTLLHLADSIAALNDDHGYAAVLQVFDAALAEYKGAPQ